MTPENLPDKGSRRRAWGEVIVSLALILLVPVLLRLPAWALGFNEDPIWHSGHLAMPGSGTFLPGLPGFLDYNAGWTTEALGTAAAHQWMAGGVPWWNSFSGVGLPLAAEMQSSALFLPYILLLLLPSGMVLLTFSLQWTAGIATWLLLRRFDLRMGAVMGALLFELSASFAWMGAPAGLPVAFLPLFLLGLERARERALSGRSGGYRTIALAIALSLYAGFPETAYLDGIMAFAWAIMRGISMRGQRGSFALRVIMGGVVGLLLSAPLLWSFFDYVLASTLGNREGMNMAVLSHPPFAHVQFLMPYALGLPAGLSGADPSSTLVWVWGRAGAFIGMGLALAALLGGVAPGSHRGLRLFLLVWIGLVVAKVSGIAGAAGALAIPFGEEIQFFRYSAAVWLLPCCMLASFAVERSTPRWRAGLAAVLLVFVGVVTALEAWPLVRTVSGAPRYFWVSLAYALVSLVGCAWAFTRNRPTIAAAVLLTDVSILFMVPLASGFRHPQLDTPAIAFLQSHIGLGRFVTLGPFQPNYGAAYAVASVNSNYLPTARLWSDYIDNHLRPGGEPALFIGNFPIDKPGQATNADVLKAHLANYEGLGVRYILVPSEADPFVAGGPVGDGNAFRLGPTDVLTGTLTIAPSRVVAMSVTIGTYMGRSSGQLELQLCAKEVCVAGEAALAGAVDNQPLLIRLATPLESDGAVTWTLRQHDGEPVAIWLWGGENGPSPSLTAKYEVAAPAISSVPGLRQVYSDRVMVIYETANPAPYFAADRCDVAAISREAVDVTCAAPSVLVRHELMLPGWRAKIGGRSIVPDMAAPLFQSVLVPEGVSRVAFSYTPPGSIAFTILFAIGVIAFLPGRLLRRLVGNVRSRGARAGDPIM